MIRPCGGGGPVAGAELRHLHRSAALLGSRRAGAAGLRAAIALQPARCQPAQQGGQPSLRGLCGGGRVTRRVERRQLAGRRGQRSLAQHPPATLLLLLVLGAAVAGAGGAAGREGGEARRTRPRPPICILGGGSRPGAAEARGATLSSAALSSPQIPGNRWRGRSGALGPWVVVWVAGGLRGPRRPVRAATAPRR